MMQKKRPVLSPGDVCKIARKYRRRFKRNISMVVLKVYGDGSDRDSIIQCSVSIPSRFGRGGFSKPYKHRFHREFLWFTGYNINSGETNKSRVGPSRALKNRATQMVVPGSFNTTRGPHKCHCDDESYARNGCTCNGL